MIFCSKSYYYLKKKMFLNFTAVSSKFLSSCGSRKRFCQDIFHKQTSAQSHTYFLANMKVCEDVSYIRFLKTISPGVLLFLYDLSFQRAPIPSSFSLRILEVSFTDFVLDDDDTVRACVRMFLELDFPEKFHINYEVSLNTKFKHLRLIQSVCQNFIYILKKEIRLNLSAYL